MAILPSQGTTFGRSNADSPETFTAIGQLTSISGVGQTRSLIEVTNLSSEAKEFRKALEEGNEITLQIQYDPDNTGHANLRADMKAEDARNYRVTLTDSPAQTITFSAICLSWVLGDITPDTVLTLTAVLKPTGDLTFA